MRHRSIRGSSRATIDILENRRLLSGTTTELATEPITIGVPGLKDITFVATNGRKTTIKVSGATAAISFPGPAALTLYQGHAFFPAGAVETISSIVVANAIPGKATLKEVGAYGTGLFDIASIVGGDLGSIIMPDVNLTGSLTLSSVKRITLGEVSAANITVGGSASKVDFTGPFTGSITAGSIGSLSASELSSANITTTDPFSKSKLEIGSIDGGTGILDSNIISAGNIGSVKAGYLQGSVITAALNAPAASGPFPSASVPQSILSIVEPATIHSVKLSSTSITSPAYFTDSVIAASSIVSLSLGQISGGGVAAETFGGLTAMGPSGSLDRFPFHLGPQQLRTATKVQAQLTKLNIPFTNVISEAEETEFYGFDLNILV